MKHLGTKNLETNRLILRKFQLDDYKLFYQNWATDERVTRYMTWYPHQNINETKELVERWSNSYDNNQFYHWIIVLKENNEPIGSMSVVDINEEKEDFEVGYCINYNNWNKGLATEAFNEVINYLFNEVNIKCVTASHDSRNVASGKVMEKCGLKYIETQDFVNKGENILLKIYQRNKE